MAEDRESAAALVRSRTRVEILKRLRAGEATKYDLRDELDCSRTTVDRNLDRLAEAGWIEATPEGYAIRTSAEFVLEQAQAYLETVGAASRLQPILKWVPRDRLDVDLRHLADADLTVPGEVTPLAMVDRHAQAIKGCSEFRSILPVTSAQPFEIHYREIIDGSLTASHVVAPSVAEVFLTDPAFEEMVAELRGHEDFAVRVTDEPIPYYLGVLDGTVQIGVDDDGEPRGLLETDDETVREWAEATIERYRASAVPLDRWADERT